MKAINKYAWLPLLAATLVFSSCSKRPVIPVEPDPSPVIGKLSKLSYADGSYDSLFYNASGLLSKIKNHYQSPMTFDEVYTFSYGSDNKLNRITQSGIEYYDYRYVAGRLTAVLHYVSGVKEDYRIYEYTNGKLTDIEEYYQFAPNSPGHELATQRSLSYYPDGNLKEEMVYFFDAQTHLPKKQFSITFSDYDVMLNPSDELSRFLYLSFLQLSKNNVRKSVSKDETSGHTTEFNFEYTYNDFSNPLTRTMTYLSNGKPKTEMVTYHYY